jgi:hypothetical protein
VFPLYIPWPPTVKYWFTVCHIGAKIMLIISYLYKNIVTTKPFQS